MFKGVFVTMKYPSGGYLGVDQVANIIKEIVPDVSYHVLGRSLGGRSVEFLTLGNGPVRVLLVGFPHGNEPSGGLLIFYLFKALAQGCAWLDNITLSAVVAASPDTAVANILPLDRPADMRAWYAGSGELPVDRQVEFSYRIDGKMPTRPEAVAVLKALNMTKPHVVAVLHDEPTVSPAYVYLHSQVRGVAERIAQYLGGIGLPILEKPYLQGTLMRARGVYSLVTGEQAGAMLGHASTAEYVAAAGVPVVLTCEIPLFGPRLTLGLDSVRYRADLDAFLFDLLAKRIPELHRLSQIQYEIGEHGLAFEHACALLERLSVPTVSPVLRPGLAEPLDRWRVLRLAGLLAWVAAGLTGKSYVEAERCIPVLDACWRDLAKLGPPRQTPPEQITGINAAVLQIVVEHIAALGGAIGGEFDNKK